MSLIKLALEKKQPFVQRHPYLSAGVALTGGIAAADAGLSFVKALKAHGDYDKIGLGFKKFMSNPAVRKDVGKETLHGLKEGALYGGILSAVEPTILHGALRKPKE